MTEEPGKVTLVQTEYDPALYCYHQTLTMTTMPGDSIGITARVACQGCGKTIEIPNIVLLEEGAFDGILNIAFGRPLTN